MKFKLRKGRGSVSGFTDAQGVTHLPGDVVELPVTYKGEKWLEPVKEEPKPVAPPSKVEPAPVSEPDAVPLPGKKEKKAK
jgi:hypothetical protein